MATQEDIDAITAAIEALVDAQMRAEEAAGQRELTPAVEAAVEVDAVEVSDDGFTIAFPVQPSVQHVQAPVDESTSAVLTIYRAPVGDAHLVFFHGDMPDDADDQDVSVWLQGSAQGVADNTGGDLVAADLVEVAGRPGIDYVVLVPGAVLRGLAVFDGDRLYTGQLIAEGEDPDAVDREPLDHLMASLRLA
ncbi:hypothetical protein BH23ACT9_BH23ACT9_13870 [soil metagenome]